MQYFVNGTKFAFSTTLAAAVAISGISNAKPAKATTLALPQNGDIVLLKSNWTELNDLGAYAEDAAGGTFSLAGVDTTDTGLYPPGEGAGSYQVAGSFISLSQIRGVEQSGGDTNTFDWGYVDDSSPRQRSKPTDQNPLVLTFTMDYDPDLPWMAALEEISRKRQLVVMRERNPTGDVFLYTGYISFQKSPTRVRNENQTVIATMTVNSEMLRYPASFFAGS